MLLRSSPRTTSSQDLVLRRRAKRRKAGERGNRCPGLFTLRERSAPINEAFPPGGSAAGAEAVDGFVGVVIAWRASVLIAESAVDDVAPSVAWRHRCNFSAKLAGARAPVAVAVFDVPDSVSQSACPVAA